MSKPLKALKALKPSKTKPKRDNISNKEGSLSHKKSWINRSIYQNIHVGSAEWRVIKKERNSEKNRKSLIPVIDQVHSGIFVMLM